MQGKSVFVTREGLVVENRNAALDIEHQTEPYSMERVLNSRGVKELLQEHTPDYIGTWEVISENGDPLGWYHGTVRALINKCRYLREYFLHTEYGYGGYFIEVKGVRELEDVNIDELAPDSEKNTNEGEN